MDWRIASTSENEVGDGVVGAKPGCSLAGTDHSFPLTSLSLLEGSCPSVEISVNLGISDTLADCSSSLCVISHELAVIA